jgi:hypothetical protein
MGLGIASAAAGALAVRQAVTQSLRPRPYLVHLADEAPVRVVEKEYATFGMPFKKEYTKSGKVGGAAAEAEPPAAWRLTEESGFNGLPEGKPGNVGNERYTQFKANVESDVRPSLAVRDFQGAKLEPYPHYKKYQPTGAHQGYDHMHSRIGGGARLFYLVNNKTKHCHVVELSLHDPSWSAAYLPV